MNEKLMYKYIYVNSNNQVYILVPVMAGETVGIDNTCKTGEAFRSFILNILPILNEYKRDLEADITQLKTTLAYSNVILKTKIKKYQQILQYQFIINRLLNSNDIRMLKTQVFPELPKGILDNMNKAQKNQNFVSISCAPEQEDSFLQMSSHHLCNFRRSQHDGGNRFSVRLKNKIVIEKLFNIKENIINKSLETLASSENIDIYTEVLFNEELFNSIKNEMNKSVKAIDPNMSISKDFSAHQEITPNLLVNIYSTLDEKASPLEIAMAILKAAFDGDAFSNKESHFSSISCLESSTEQKEKFSIAVQLFIAYINMYCYEHDLLTIATTNIGEYIENDVGLQNTIINRLNEAFNKKGNYSPHDSTISPLSAI